MMRSDLEAAVAASTTAGDARRTQMLEDALADIEDATPKNGVIVVASEADGVTIRAQLKTDVEAAGLFTSVGSVLTVHDADPETEDEPTFVVHWETCVGCPPLVVDRDVTVYYDHAHWEALVQGLLDERPGTIAGP